MSQTPRGAGGVPGPAGPAQPLEPPAGGWAIHPRQPRPVTPGQAEWEWHRTAALLGHPNAAALMLAVHRLGDGRRHCVQCGPHTPWPCAFWTVATLARIHQAGPPPRRGRLLSWPRRRAPTPWFDAPVG